MASLERRTMISSSSNQQIKNLIQLQTKAKARNKEKVYVIEGIKMFEEVCDCKDAKLIKAFVAESFFETLSSQKNDFYKKLLQQEYEVVSDKVFKEISETMTPQGILAIVKQPEYTLEQILSGDLINLIVLEDLRDPGNLGTIIRTAEGAGVTGIILSKASVDVFNPKVIRSTMGAIYRVPFVYVEDIQDTLQKLKEKQITMYATHLHATHYYDEVTYGNKTAVLIGNEANGLSKESAEQSDELIKIPMEGKVESLNAGVATAIMIYEIYRQRRKH